MITIIPPTGTRYWHISGPEPIKMTISRRSFALQEYVIEKWVESAQQPALLVETIERLTCDWHKGQWVPVVQDGGWMRPSWRLAPAWCKLYRTVMEE